MALHDELDTVLIATSHLMPKLDTVKNIMRVFAAETGLINPAQAPRRYLWTDAFAVCNFLELYRQTGQQEYLDLALKLVDQVHATLGKHHEHSGKHGWFSGLDEENAKRHPTIGGLRIGKKLHERQADDAFDENLEWDRDGQYFHYLTKWMHTLNAVSGVTGSVIFLRWAMELARVAHAAFTYSPATGGPMRMYWKMSTDLSRPLVESMGQHDPLDGLLTYLELDASTERFPAADTGTLEAEVKDMRALCEGHRWATEDSLGIGGLLSDAWKLLQLIDTCHLEESYRLESLLEDIKLSIDAFLQHNTLHLLAQHRLAFRELGLSIGLQALAKMQKRLQQVSNWDFQNKDQLEKLLKNLVSVSDLHNVIDSFWLDQTHQAVNTWQEHKDINQVMLATSLVPDSFLDL
jgi:hypothetical protein